MNHEFYNMMHEVITQNQKIKAVLGEQNILLDRLARFEGSEMTEEKAVALLEKSGWMRSHDKQVAETAEKKTWETARRYVLMDFLDWNDIVGEDISRKDFWRETSVKDAVRMLERDATLRRKAEEDPFDFNNKLLEMLKNVFR